MLAVNEFILDCSMTMAWCFEDESDEHAEMILNKLTEGTTATPPIWLQEVCNLLLVAERRKRITRKK